MTLIETAATDSGAEVTVQVSHNTCAEARLPQVSAAALQAWAAAPGCGAHSGKRLTIQGVPGCACHTSSDTLARACPARCNIAACQHGLPRQALNTGLLPAQLQSLTLAGLQLSESGLKSISAGLQEMAQLTHLALPGCGIKCATVAALAQVVQHMPALRALDVSRNPLASHDDATSSGRVGPQVSMWVSVRFPVHPVVMLLQAAPKLESLQLHNTVLTHRFAAKLAEALEYVQALQQLDCTGTPMSADMLESVQAAAEGLPQMRVLRLPLVTVPGTWGTHRA